jgi:hypothetical protein
VTIHKRAWSNLATLARKVQKFKNLATFLGSMLEPIV